MISRIAVPLLAVSLLAVPAFGLEPSPKPSPAASPANVVSSPKPSPTPAKHALRTRKSLKKVATAAHAKTQRQPHVSVATPPSTTPPNGAVK